MTHEYELGASISAESRLAALIGDVVASRRYGSRAELQDRLATSLAEVNDVVPSVQPLTVSLGDEFQGLYSTVGSAVEATLLVRLSLFGTVDVRFGIGWGTLLTFEPGREPFGQDGPAWWAARDAIRDAAAHPHRKERPKGLRTVFRGHRETPRGSEEAPESGGVDDAVNAYLVCRDEIVFQMDARDVRLLLGLMRGQRQGELAATEGISQSAVSQRLRTSGAYAVLGANRAFREVAGW